MNRTESIPVYDSARRRVPALEELQEILRYRNLLVQMVRRDILTRYKRSVLGVAWTMLNPLGTMIVLTIAFSSVFGGTRAYAAYVLSGLIAWTFFSLTTNAAIVNLVWGGSLLRRIYIPPTTFAVSAIGTGLVNMVLSIIPLLIVMAATRVPIKVTFLLLPIPMIILAVFSLGLGLLISAVAIYFADVAEMYQVALTAWMYLTPIIYPETIIPSKYLWIIRLNPMYHLVKFFRAPIYDGRLPTPSELLISTTIAVVTLIIGWFIFTRRADEFAYRV
jgi:homopolymeric O-antigen transport system permease protein